LGRIAFPQFRHCRSLDGPTTSIQHSIGFNRQAAIGNPVRVFIRSSDAHRFAHESRKPVEAALIWPGEALEQIMVRDDTRSPECDVKESSEHQSQTPK